MRDTGDGTAYKVDGMRGGVYVGQAGDARGTQALRDEDGAAARSALDAYRAEVEQARPSDDGFVGMVVPLGSGRRAVQVHPEDDADPPLHPAPGLGSQFRFEASPNP